MLVEIAKHRFFPTAKGVIGQRHRNWHVDADHAHIDAVRKVTRGVAITGENGGAVTIFVIHGKAERLFIGFSTHR